MEGIIVNRARRRIDKLDVVLADTSALVPYARNSREHSEEQIEAIARSISEFGFTNPVLIDKKGTIVAGHGRVLAAQKLGLKKVPTITLAHLTRAQVRAYIVADNKLAELSTWNEDILRGELAELDLKADFDLSKLGFSEVELREITEPPKPPKKKGKLKIDVEIKCPQCGHTFKRP